MKGNLHSVQSSKNSWISSILRSPAKVGVVLALSAAALVSACEAPDQTAGVEGTTAQPQLGETQDPASTETAQQAAAQDAEELIGQTVAINGEVNEVYGPNAFRLEAEDTFTANEEVLVLVTGQTAPALNEGEAVQLTGEVQRFDSAEIQNQYGAELDQTLISQLAEDYEGRPVIITENVDQLASELPNN
jgi:RecJ-like exonuclease